MPQVCAGRVTGMGRNVTRIQASRTRAYTTPHAVTLHQVVRDPIADQSTIEVSTWRLKVTRRR
jgi:hypothetical protein